VIPHASDFSRTSRVLRLLVRVSCYRPVWTVALSLLLGVLGLAGALSRLGFETSTRALLPQNAGYVLRYAEYTKDFGELEDIVVVVEARSPAVARAYAAQLASELARAPVPFHRVAYRVDPKRFEGRQLLYLPTAKLGEIRDKIFDHQDFMERFAADPSLAGLLEGVNRQVASAFVANFLDLGLQEQDRPFDPRFLDLLLDQLASYLGGRRVYQSPWGTLLSFDAGQADAAGYFVSDDRRLLFVLVETPAGEKGSFVGDRNAIEAIRDAFVRLRPAFPDVQAGVTGAPALSNDEMSAAFHDSEVAAALAFALTLLLMMLAFRRVGQPLLLLGVLAVTLTWALGIVSLTVGHLTLFSVMFISIVVGVGIDYGVYFLSRYREETLLGRSVSEALEHTAARSGPGILIAALTAGGTFLVLLLTDFRGIQELGFVAGVSILLAGLSTLTTFPALLLVADQRQGSRRAGHPAPHPGELRRLEVPMLDRLTRHPWSVLIAAAVVTACSAWGVAHMEFDYNVLNLQPKRTESVVWEKRVLETTGRSGFSALSSARDLDELRRKQEAFERLSSVAEVDSVLRVIPDGQAEKIAIIDSFAPLVGAVQLKPPSAVSVARMKTALGVLKRRLDVIVAESTPTPPPEVLRILDKTRMLLNTLDHADRAIVEMALGELQAELSQDFRNKVHTLQGNLKPTVVTTADIPEELRGKFIGKSGHFLMQIHPRGDTWEKEDAARFVRELRSVDADVTGASIITHEATLLMERAYLQGTIYAFALVGTLSALMIGHRRETLLAMLPLALGLTWTIGLLHVFGITFNLANIWGLPLIIGTSAEFGLNVVLRYLEGRAYGGPLVARSTVTAVALNGLIMMGGFGSLMVASHRGIFSLGLLLTVGTACGVFASLVILPVALRLLTRQSEQPAETTRALSDRHEGGDRLDVTARGLDARPRERPREGV